MTNYLPKKHRIWLLIFLFLLILLLFYIYFLLDEVPSSGLRGILFNGISKAGWTEFNFTPGVSSITIKNLTAINMYIEFAGIRINNVKLNNQKQNNCSYVGIASWIRCDIGTFNDSSLDLEITLPLNGIFDITTQGKEVQQWWINLYLENMYQCNQPCFVDMALPPPYEDKIKFVEYPDIKKIYVGPEINTGENKLHTTFQINTIYKRTKAIKEYLYAIIISLIFFVLTLGYEVKKEFQKSSIWILLLGGLVLLVMPLIIIFLLNS